MPALISRWRLLLGLGGLLAFFPASRAAVIVMDASAGKYGTPYGYLGPNVARVWENYRKRFDTAGSPSPNVTAVNQANPTRVIRILQDLTF